MCPLKMVYRCLLSSVQFFILLPEHRFFKKMLLAFMPVKELAQTELTCLFIQLCKTLHLTDNSCNHSGRLIKTEILRSQYNEKLRNKYPSGISFKTYKLNSLKIFLTERYRQQSESEFEMNIYIQQGKWHRKHVEPIGKAKVLYLNKT